MMVNYGHVTQRGLCFISKWLSGYILHSQFISHPKKYIQIARNLKFCLCIISFYSFILPITINCIFYNLQNTMN